MNDGFGYEGDELLTKVQTERWHVFNLKWLLGMIWHASQYSAGICVII
jgi:hypothetical protein